MIKRNLIIGLLLTLALLLTLSKTAPIDKVALAQNSTTEEVLDLNLHYNQGKITVNSLDKGQGYLPDTENQPQNGYELQLLDNGANELFKIKFNFPLQVVTDEFNTQGQPRGSIKTLQEGSMKVTIPLKQNAAKILVIDPQKQVVLEQELSSIKAQETQTSSAPTHSTQKPIFKLLLVSVLLILIIVFGVWYFKKRSSSGTQY